MVLPTAKKLAGRRGDIHPYVFLCASRAGSPVYGGRGEDRLYLAGGIWPVDPETGPCLRPGRGAPPFPSAVRAAVRVFFHSHPGRGHLPYDAPGGGGASPGLPRRLSRAFAAGKSAAVQMLNGILDHLKSQG